MQDDSTLVDTVANTLTIGGVLAFIIKLTPYITTAVLLSALTLNVLRIIDWFKTKNKNAHTSKKIRTKG
jgi:hypothetical protein